MSLSNSLETRSESKCELCSTQGTLLSLLVPPKNEDADDFQAVLCENCHAQIKEEKELDKNHWRCINESMWSEVPAVKVLAYRMLDRLKTEDWAVDLINMMYLDEETLEWAQSAAGGNIIHKDSNGNILTAGDTVTLIQDLNVKGANFTAKRGTAVRRIRLVHDNAEHIEGKVDGQQIVILTKFVKKSS